jgi:hypothetical protein
MIIYIRNLGGYDESVLMEQYALPSEDFPSDHVAIIADVELR